MNIDYGKIINRSIELIKKNKWLWVYGLTLAALSGGSSGGSGGGTSSSSTKNKKIPEDLPEKAKEVLGETITAVQDWFYTVPITTWILIGIGIFISIVLWIIVSWIIQSWAKGGLIAGLEDADNEKPVTLATTAHRGIASIISLMIFGLTTAGLVFFTIFIAVVLVVGGYLLLRFAPPLDMIWLVIVIILVVFINLLVFILVNMISIYAERLIVLKGYTPWEAWKKGLSLSRGNLLPTMVMAVINTSIGCFGGCLATIVLLMLLGLPAFLILLPMIMSGQWKTLGIPTIGGLGIILFLFIQLNYLINAAFILFNFSNWNLLFKEVWEKEKHS